MTKQTQTAMQALLDLGQSVWLDYLRRGMFRSGELQSLIDDGLRGMTSNPTIFEQAIGGSSDYDEARENIRRLSDVLEETSICGLGKVVSKPMQSVILHFPEEVEAHVNRQECPANVCFNKAEELP